MRQLVVQEPTAILVDGEKLHAVPSWRSVAADRLVLIVKTGNSSRREAMLAMAAEAGYPDAELIGEAVAATLDPHTRPDLPDGALVLVCSSLSAALVRLDPEQPQQLAEETAGAGLSGLDEFSLRWLVASCRAVVARAGYHLGEVAVVLALDAGAAQALRAELGRPVLMPAEHAVLRGAIHWASTARNIPAVPASWRVEPLCWSVPDRSRLLRWMVGVGQSYPSGACLAKVRAPDERVYDLTANREGILVEQRVAPGGYVSPETVSAMARSAILISGDRPTKKMTMKVSGDWMLTPDHSYLVECADSGAYARMRTIDTGAIVDEVRPGLPRGHGRVFVHPGGGLAMVCWDDVGQFGVWEVPSGRLISQFRSSARPLSVLVNEGEWRLASEVDRKVSVGRYRRDVATVWDLNTGSVVEEMVGDDLHRRFTGYAERSPTHGFSDEVRSPDGRLRAGSTLLDGHACVWLQQASTDEELFRADVSAPQVRSAFSADGHYLLSRWRDAEVSCLDVWKI